MRWLLAVLVLAVALGSWDYFRFMQRPFGQATQLIVRPGDSIATVEQNLFQQGQLDRPLYLQLHARFSGEARRIRAGEYHLSATTTARSLLEQLVRGEVVQHQLAIIEGWTFEQLLAALRAHPSIRSELERASAEVVMRQLGHPDQAAEGRFFPDTYFFPTGTTDLAFLRRAYDTMQRHLAEAWAARTPDVQLSSPHELLVLASIIERESGYKPELGDISGVFHRRLARGMRLQSDPTVIYGMGDAYEGRLLRRHLREDSPWNTYTRHGLPPTPIALPSRAALMAAAQPEAGNALYFVAAAEGPGHVFSVTLAEHNRAVRRYREARDR